MANEFKVRKGLIVQGSGSNIFDVQGSQGQLFSITDSLSGSLFSVNDISGIPIMEVFSDNTIKMGTFNQEAIIVSGSRTGMGIATPQAKLHISGANNDSLFRIQSPASASIMFVSGSGLVGIGTLTPTQKISVDNGNVGFTSGFGISWDSDTEWVRRAAASDQLQLATQNTIRLNIGSTQGQLVAIGLGATAASAQFQVRGGGATAATTAMRIEDSGGNARLTILDNGTSAFNTSHLYVSSSGRVGVGTTTPRELLHVGGGNLSLDSTRYIDFGNGNSRINDLGLVSGQGYSLRITTFGPIGTGTANSLTEKLRLTGSGSLGLGTDSPSARFHISGGFTDGNLMRVQSPTGAEYFFISASGNVGIGTNLPSADLHISGTSADNLLRVGSPSNDNILFVTGSGRVGIGTAFPSSSLTVSGTIESLPVSTDEGGQLTLRAATGRSFRWNVDNYQDNFRIFRENDPDSSSGAVRILISGSSGNVGIHTTAPTEWIYLSTTPSSGKYLNIDAVQTSNNPPDYGPGGGGGVDRIIGNTLDNFALGTPDYWMEIKLNGGIVLIPAYLPSP